MAVFNLPTMCFCTPAMLGSRNICGIAEVYENDCIIIKAFPDAQTVVMLPCLPFVHGKMIGMVGSEVSVLQSLQSK